MHRKFFVTFNQEQANTSLEARRHVIEQLHNEHFCCGEGRWARGIAKWFVIGGHWSGELSRHSWAKEITEQMRAEEEKQGVRVRDVLYEDKDRRKQQEQLAKEFNQMWNEAAPQLYQGISCQRESNEVEGYIDDAMLLTEELYDNLLQEYQGSDESESHADLDYEAVSPKMIGRKWLVVVDYYS